jgi:DNA topoisomerase III
MRLDQDAAVGGLATRSKHPRARPGGSDAVKPCPRLALQGDDQPPVTCRGGRARSSDGVALSIGPPVVGERNREDDREGGQGNEEKQARSHQLDYTAGSKPVPCSEAERRACAPTQRGAPQEKVAQPPELDGPPRERARRDTTVCMSLKFGGGQPKSPEDERIAERNGNAQETRRLGDKRPCGHDSPFRPLAKVSRVPKTLVIAEKPSVGRDLAGALPGTFEKHDAHLESDDYVVTWAVGHLVGLAEPDSYDDRYKKWRFADLPIVPDKFKLVPNDEKAKKQLRVVHTLMKREDVDLIVNACDAGREGELIFAYTYETSGVRKPVKRLWLNSMTRRAIEEAFAQLRDGEEMKLLEAAARSRSEADWLVGMNATRAASIRLRAAFDGAVSLGRVQTPTLALVARREKEIREFKPEPYWLVEALFAATGERRYSGRYLGGKRIAEEEANAIVAACTDRPGTITKLEKKEEREQAPLLYDLTALQRHANTLLGFSARRTLAAAQKLYEEHKAITYPRTNSRFLPGEMIGEIKPTANLVGRNREYTRAAEYVTRLEKLPLGRVVNDKKVEDHHAIIPTKAEHNVGRMRPDEQKIYDLVARRFLAVFHPEAVYERTRVETTVEEHVFRTSGRVLVTAGWKGVYGEEVRSSDAADDDTGGDQLLPPLEQGETVETRSVDALRKETQPPRRYSEASLLAAMETAGKDIDDVNLREAMKDSGIGTPATRASIIERLIDVGYIEREGRALHATEKGIKVVDLLDGHPLTSAELTGEWEHRLGLIEQGDDNRSAFMSDIERFTTETVNELDKLKGVKIERANLGPCPVCGRDVIENRKGYSCWTRDDPGCGFVVWKVKAGKTLPPAVVKELMETRRTAKPVAGFKGRSGRTFKAKLKLEQDENGKWRVDFDEEWAQQPTEGQAEEASAESGDGAVRPRRRARRAA